MPNVDELGTALAFPWEKWTVFLHPEQRQWAQRHYNGPARVSGSAGTGKTIVRSAPRCPPGPNQSQCPSPADQFLRQSGQWRS